MELGTAIGVSLVIGTALGLLILMVCGFCFCACLRHKEQVERDRRGGGRSKANESSAAHSEAGTSAPAAAHSSQAASVGSDERLPEHQRVRS